MESQPPSILIAVLDRRTKTLDELMMWVMGTGYDLVKLHFMWTGYDLVLLHFIPSIKIKFKQSECSLYYRL